MLVDDRSPCSWTGQQLPESASGRTLVGTMTDPKTTTAGAKPTGPLSMLTCAKSAVAVLVDLWAPWCGPCRVVGPMLEALSKEYAGRIKVVKVNVDENPGLSQQFQATSIPTLLVLKDGRVVDRIVGALPLNDLKMRLFPYLMRS